MKRDYLSHYIRHGYCVIDLKNVDALCLQRDALLHDMRKLTGLPTATLEKYHQAVATDTEHERLHIILTRRFRQHLLLHQLLTDNKHIFTRLVGEDLLAQREPYLRIVRPRCPEDSIGFHRDTFYGGSPYEISLVIPFVDLDAKNSLQIQPGSHTVPEAKIPLRQTVSETIHKGSPRHNLGFLYAPKIIAPDYPLRMRPIPLRFGQILAFSLATLHGTTNNTSENTRWSTDLRIVSSLAPVDLSARPTYYQSHFVSPATQVALNYFKSNG